MPLPRCQGVPGRSRLLMAPGSRAPGRDSPRALCRNRNFPIPTRVKFRRWASRWRRSTAFTFWRRTNRDWCWSICMRRTSVLPTSGSSRPGTVPALPDSLCWCLLRWPCPLERPLSQPNRPMNWRRWGCWWRQWERSLWSVASSPQRSVVPMRKPS